MKHLTTPKIDLIILNSLINLLAILMLPLLVAKTWPLAAPLDFFIVLLFCLLYCVYHQIKSENKTVQIIINCLLVVPPAFLFWHKATLIAILLTLQFVINLALLTPTTRTGWVDRLIQILEQGVIPFFLTICLLDTILENIKLTQVLIIGGLYLIKVLASFNLKGFSDFLWPFLSILLAIIMQNHDILSTFSSAIIVIGLLISVIAYPKRRALTQYPSWLMIFISLASQLPTFFK